MICMLATLELLVVRIYMTVNVTRCRYLEYLREQSNYVTFSHFYYILCFSEKFI